MSETRLDGVSADAPHPKKRKKEAAGSRLPSNGDAEKKMKWSVMKADDERRIKRMTMKKIPRRKEIRMPTEVDERNAEQIGASDFVQSIPSQWR